MAWRCSVASCMLLAEPAPTAAAAQASGTIPRRTRGRRGRRWGRRGTLTSVAVLDGKLYAVGGYDGVGYYDDAVGYYDAGRLSSVERYDPATNAWEAVAPMATARLNFGVASLRG